MTCANKIVTTTVGV